MRLVYAASCCNNSPPDAICRDVATKKWGKDCGLLPKIIDIESEHQQHQKENKVYVLIGTLYKDMSLRGSVSPGVAPFGSWFC